MAGWFLLVLLSGGCDSPVGVAERAAHWWDAADFADTTLTVHPEALEERFAEYVRLLEDERMDPAVAGALLCTVLGRAEANEEVFSLLGELCEKYLYSPDSPCRDEELYRHALLAPGRLPQLAAELLPTEQDRAAHQRHQHQKRRPQCRPEGVPPPVPVVLCMHPAPLPFCREYGPLCRNYAACGLCSCVRPGFVLW